MNALARNIAQRPIDHPLAFEAALVRKGGGFDHDGEMRFAAAVVTRMAGMLRAVVDHGEAGGREGLRQQPLHFLLDGFWHGAILSFGGFPNAALLPILTRMRPTKFHGRYQESGKICMHPTCTQPGEFRAPGSRSGSFDGPGEWRWFCLEHVREFNAGYDWFEGMSAEEIYSAQAPAAGWRTESPTFRAAAGLDGMPRWADYDDPLDAIAARARGLKSRVQREAELAMSGKFSREEAAALEAMDLGTDTDSRRLRRRYSELVRRYHPDRNGGDRRHEARLRRVVEAYQLLRKSQAIR